MRPLCIRCKRWHYRSQNDSAMVSITESITPLEGAQSLLSCGTASQTTPSLAKERLPSSNSPCCGDLHPWRLRALFCVFKIRWTFSRQVEQEALGETANPAWHSATSPRRFPDASPSSPHSPRKHRQKPRHDRCAVRSAVLNWRMPAAYPGHAKPASEASRHRKRSCSDRHGCSGTAQKETKR